MEYVTGLSWKYHADRRFHRLMTGERSESRHGRLKPFLDRVHERYHRPDYLGSDPLVVVRQFRSPKDREIAALFAALLAYGNVKQINSSLGRLFGKMPHGPWRFVYEYRHEDATVALNGFKHRFNDSQDILCLCWLLHQVLMRGSLEEFFLLGYAPESEDLAGATARFVDNLCALRFEPHFDRDMMLARRSFRHLLPRQDGGSACKRLNLFLRWMVRPDDGIDLGLWTRIPAARLLVPVDTHIHRIATNLGILSKRGASLAAAREITRHLRDAQPADPVRYDFGLCRIGILKRCPPNPKATACRECELNPVCRARRSPSRRSRR
jgi:uncharacterized protein (TIGR02757 family)